MKNKITKQKRSQSRRLLLAEIQEGTEQPYSNCLKPGQCWKTAKQMANRYQLSIRTVAYLVEDRILPVYKIGHCLRFNPVECDMAMRAFRRSSKFDEASQAASDK